METLTVVFTNGAFILAIVFQLSAAWMLVGNTVVTRDGIIKAFCANRQAGIPFDKNGNLLDRSALETTVITAWTNKIAFIFLGIGYLLSVFGSCSIDKRIVLVIVLILSAILVIISIEYARRKGREFESPSLVEIPFVDGVAICIVGDEEHQKEDLLQ